MLPVWARYAKLRTQLYPYLAAAESEYDRSGMPLMRHLALAYPARRARDGPRGRVPARRRPAGRAGRAAGRARARPLPAGRALDRLVALDLARRGTARRTSARRGPRRRARRDAAGAARRAAAARAGGAVIPLLDPSVETLADYGEGTAVRLRDRDDRLRLLAWPRGRSTARLGLGRAAASGSSPPTTGGGWALEIRGSTGARTRSRPRSGPCAAERSVRAPS